MAMKETLKEEFLMMVKIATHGVPEEGFILVSGRIQRRAGDRCISDVKRDENRGTPMCHINSRISPSGELLKHNRMQCVKEVIKVFRIFMNIHD
jgi:hypothetical protein